VPNFHNDVVIEEHRLVLVDAGGAEVASLERPGEIVVHNTQGGRVTDITRLCSLSSDASRHFGYTGVTDDPPGTGRADDALAGAYHEEEVPFRWMSSRRTTRSSISVM
jgi:hypothetical protein